MSSAAAAEQLRNDVCTISRSTICRELKKPVETDKCRYTHVGIDDFALRRGHTDGTCMVHHETHTAIDMIPTRDPEEVTPWLKTWKSLRLVTRDGSRTYRAAIRSAHPSCVQTADRFHLVKNVLEGADKTVRSMLPRKVVLSDSTEAGDTAEKQAETELLTESGCGRRDRASGRGSCAGILYSQIGKYPGLDCRPVRKNCDKDGPIPAENAPVSWTRSVQGQLRCSMKENVSLRFLKS